MCLGSRPSAPQPAPKLPEAPRTPDPDTGVGSSDLDRRRRLMSSGGGGVSTILTGPRGVTTPGQTATKTLLGS